MKRKLIVCEGLDCSGKTTAIEEIINSNPQYVYCKGIGSDSSFGRIAKRFPSTFMFLSELVYNTYTQTIPNLREDKVVLQDRYDISVASYVPNTNRWYNQLLIHTARLLIPKPNAIVYLHLPLEERIKRLRQKGKKYELSLAENPRMITLREKEYQRWFSEFAGSKIDIDSYKNDLKTTARILGDFVETLR